MVKILEVPKTQFSLSRLFTQLILLKYLNDECPCIFIEAIQQKFL